MKGPIGTYTTADGRRFMVKPCPACKRPGYRLNLKNGEGRCGACGYTERLEPQKKKEAR
jgi:uncharacterized Zn finger protein (UPF0148 family)